MLSEIRVHNDLGHPMCCNLRDGDWMADYIVGRLKNEPKTEKLGKWIEVSCFNEFLRFSLPEDLT